MFRFYTYSPDSELQQRACEYLALATLPTDDLLRTVCDEMPAFSERASILLQRLHKKSVGTSERRTWLVGGKDANADQKEVLLSQQTGLKRSFTTIVNGNKPTTNGSSAATTGTTNGSSKDLEGLDLLSQEEPKARNLASAAHLSPEWELGFNLLYFRTEGILFEDSQIQVGLRQEYRGHMGVIKVYFTNKAAFPVGSFTTTLDNQSATALKIDTKALPESNVGAQSQTQQTIVCTALAPFEHSPTIRISYLAGALQGYTLRLPVLNHRFMDPSSLSAEDFFKRWRQIGGGAMEAQATFGLRDQSAQLDEGIVNSIVEDFRWKVLPDVDPNPDNVVGCAVFQMEKGKAGCLMRLEPNKAEKMFRLTVRATQDTIPGILVKAMQEKLSLLA